MLSFIEMAVVILIWGDACRCRDASRFVCIERSATIKASTERLFRSCPQPYMANLTSLFLSMKKVVGRQFEQGLANLKTVSEQEG
ncbi:MAG TPA: hypothetical protein VFR82_05125 [Nitrospira sp.]|nr:hypothetical protein [Nitrospira sp.]